MKITWLAITLLAAAAATACRSNQSASESPVMSPSSDALVIGTKVPPARALPKAVIYKTNGDYRDNVPVTMNDDGSRIINYPAPSDISDHSVPIPVADGYLLDRRGVNKNTRFTRYSYEQYRALTSPPSMSQLLDSLIPGARITEIRHLDITPNEAALDTSLVNSIIRDKRLAH